MSECTRCKLPGEFDRETLLGGVDCELCCDCATFVMGQLHKHEMYLAYHLNDQMIKWARRNGTPELVGAAVTAFVAAQRELHEVVLKLLEVPDA